VRRLTAGDFLKLSRIVKKGMVDIGRIDFTRKPGEDDTAFGIRVGRDGLIALMDHCYEDMVDFLVDLSSKAREEFEAMPFTYPMDLVLELSESEDLRAFFSQASALVKKRQQ